MQDHSHPQPDLSPALPPRAVAGPLTAQRVPQLPSTLTGPPDPMGLARALKRRLGLALGIGIVVATIVGGVAWVVVPRSQYTAEAVLHVAATPPRILFSTVETENVGRDEYSRYQQTQLAKIRSRLVIEAVLQRPGVAEFQTVRQYEDPVEGLLADLEVGFANGSELLSIKLSGDEPRELADLVNAVKDAYMELRVNADHRQRMERHDRLKELKAQYVESLNNKREEMKHLAETVGSDDRETLALKQQFALEHLATMEKELLGVRTQKRRLEAMMGVLEATPAAGADAGAPLDTEQVERLIDADPIVAQLRDRVIVAEDAMDRAVEQLRRVSRRYQSDPSIIRYRNEVQLARRALEERRESLRPVVARGGRVDPAGTTSQGFELRQEMALLEDLETRLVSEVEQLQEGSHTLNVNTLDLQAIQDELEQLQATADQIGTEVESLNVELQAPPRIETMEDAVVPSMKSEKKRYTMIAMATMGSFGACLFGVSFLEFQTRKLDSAEEVVLGLGVPLVGALPRLPARARREGTMARRPQDRRWHNLLLESVDATRTMLLHAARTGSHRVIMITSALAGEGKTSLSCHLAISLARGGQRTLLIDGDLRSPGVGRLFDLSPAPGLGEVLRGEATPEEAIVPMPVEGLDAMVAGHCDERAIRALTCGEIGPLFARLKERYDFVIVDSSPVLPVAEAQLIAQQADAVLFSVMRHVSRAPKVFAAHHRLATLGVRILGAVMTGGHGGLYGNDYGNDYRYPAGSKAEPAAGGGTA